MVYTGLIRGLRDLEAICVWGEKDTKTFSAQRILLLYSVSVKENIKSMRTGERSVCVYGGMGSNSKSTKHVPSV